MLNFKLILNEKISLKETSGDDLADKLSNDVNRLLPNGYEEELVRLFKTHLSAAYLGQNAVEDDFGSYFNRIKSDDPKKKLYAAVAIRSYSYRDVIDFYKKHQSELDKLDLNIVKQAVQLALQNGTLSYSQAEQQVRSEGEV